MKQQNKHEIIIVLHLHKKILGDILLRCFFVQYRSTCICHLHLFCFLQQKCTSRQRSGKGAIRKRLPLQKPRWEKTKHPDESKTRTHRLSKLPDDGDPWAPNNLLTPEQKKNTSWTPVGQATDKKLRSQPTKMNSFKSGPS